jgi:hypothetical protein
MRRLLLIAVVAIIATFAALTVGSTTANAYGYACAIQDPPPAPYTNGSGGLTGSARTICQTPAYKLQIVVCLVRYPSSSTTNGTPRGCVTRVAYYSTGITGIASTSCNYTTYLYTWRVEAYAIATINGGTFKSPVVLSNPYYRLCA